MKQLIKKLNDASFAYYGKDSPIMSDKEYDDLYDQLVVMENDTGIVLAGSPTQRVQGYVLDGYNKVTHSKPMLSAAKTKDPNEIKKFVGKHDFYGSYKLDGLTTVVRYECGELIQGITRGNGIEGEDVTAACHFISNLPIKIPYNEPLELRGECVISWNEFERINSILENPYSHPRNLAAGTLRNLDLNIVAKRKLSFVAFECVTDVGLDSKCSNLEFVESLGFETVKRTNLGISIDETIKILKPDSYQYPSDGIIFELNSNSYSRSLGATDHHENCRMALKWADDLYVTTLRDIEWSTSRTGLINPVAVFDEVDLDGAITSRATLHNVSYIEKLELGIGDEIEIYRANMVIPKVHDNLTRSNSYKLPHTCPCCGGPVEIHNDNGSKTLHCCNDTCSAKLLSRLCHFVSKKGMDIDGLSEATLKKFIDLGWVTNINDIYHLDKHFPELKKMNGFGKRSVENLSAAIEDSKRVTLSRFITALGIPGIGDGQTRIITKQINSWSNFAAAGMGDYRFSDLDGIGDVLNKNIHDWFKTMYYADNVEDLAKLMLFKGVTYSQTPQNLSGKIFVITGSLDHYMNRDALKAAIEAMGGKVSGSISSKTTYLINNDSESNSSKNKKAKELNIPIITEEQFLSMLK